MVAWTQNVTLTKPPKCPFGRQVFLENSVVRRKGQKCPPTPLRGATLYLLFPHEIYYLSDAEGRLLSWFCPHIVDPHRGSTVEPPWIHCGYTVDPLWIHH